MVKKITWLAVFVFVSTISIAQNIDPNNLQNLNVDQLTDAQVGKFIEQVESNGYTEDQLLVLAKARGMSDAQISKLRSRINEYRSKSMQESGSTSSSGRIRELPQTSQRKSEYDPFLSIVPEDTTDTEELKIFGLSFFRNQNLSFEPSLNVPTPANYQIGPGDEIIIDVWGASEQNYQLTVSPEGAIRIPNLGPIYLNGLTVQRATARIKYRLKSIYSTLGDNTFAEVSLGQVRTIKVNVVGEVRMPGTFTVTSFTSAFNALYLAGGPTNTGSLRIIEVYRGGKKVGELDAYKYLVSGDAQPITLHDQDVILVNPYLNRVYARGEVKRPAIYEMKEGDKLSDLISYAGGFTEEAFYETLSIRRNTGSYKRIESVKKEEFASFGLKNGDDLEVKAITNIYQSRVTLEGAVIQPGEYAWTEGLTLEELIEQANGLRGDAFMGRAVVLRQKDDFTLENLSLDLTEVLNGSKTFELKNEDLIKIQSIYDLRQEYTVRIEGEVLMPGNYPFSDNQTVEDLIYLAGGFKESAARSFVEVARRINPDSSSDVSKTAEIYNFPISKNLELTDRSSKFKLKPFDLVVIRKSPFYEDQIMIEIEGEVKYPGKYALQSKDERISDVIKRAGGLTPYAYPKGATLIRRTEYFVSENDSDETGEAARIRRQELQGLLQRDTLVESSQAQLKQQEAIGIRLEEILAKAGSEFDLVLRRGDVISIPKELQTVRVRGQVLYPSNIRYVRGASLKNYVGRSGGLTDDARAKRAYVVYANGSAEKTRSFLWFKSYPKIEPGAEIIIPKKPARDKLSAGEVISLSSGIATLSLVVLRLIDYTSQN